MNRSIHPALPLCVGLLCAQVVATAQVYLSNTALHGKLILIQEAGYLPVPNALTMPGLLQLGPAFWGGLFFTLSVGAGLSLLTILALWIWVHLFSGKKSYLALYALIWVGSLTALNLRGLNPMVSLYFVLVPAGVFITGLKCMGRRQKEGVWLDRLIFLLPLLLLALAWTWKTDSRLFLDIRDKLLLSNSVGNRINDFYYKYTFYAAEAFKSLEQKTLKTCRLEIQQGPIVRALERTLLNYDYLPLDGERDVDLRIERQGDGLIFKKDQKRILRSTLKGFLSHPASRLREYSEKTDRHSFFRRFTFRSLLVGFPITLYVFLYLLLRLCLSPFLDGRTASAIASSLCLAAGMGALIAVQMGAAGNMDTTQLAEALRSKSWQKRVSALRTIQDRRMEISDFPAYRRLLQSPYVPERYWLVKTMAVSRRPETYRDLLAFLDDPHPNVLSMAFYALGQRREQGAIDEIMKRIRLSINWYNQWYAYRALRSLGWKQEKSSSRP